MAIKRYVANADNTITNAYKSDLELRATGSNAGAADIVETYSIYGRQSTSSVELSRILMKFPIDSITTDRNNGVIPASGSVDFILRLYNAPHSRTVPENYTIVVEPLANDWEEGPGLDLETYKEPLVIIDLTDDNPNSSPLIEPVENISSPSLPSRILILDVCEDIGLSTAVPNIKF